MSAPLKRLVGIVKGSPPPVRREVVLGNLEERFRSSTSWAFLVSLDATALAALAIAAREFQTRIDDLDRIEWSQP